jgi:hypothetical protein
MKNGMRQAPRFSADNTSHVGLRPQMLSDANLNTARITGLILIWGAFVIYDPYNSFWNEFLSIARPLKKRSSISIYVSDSSFCLLGPKTSPRGIATARLETVHVLKPDQAIRFRMRNL